MGVPLVPIVKLESILPPVTDKIRICVGLEPSSSVKLIPETVMLDEFASSIIVDATMSPPVSGGVLLTTTKGRTIAEGSPALLLSLSLKEANNVENAKIFQNFIMLPENAAMMSAFARYANGIKGSEKYMPEDMLTAPEIVVSAEIASKGQFIPACEKSVNDMYTKIWTSLLK